MTSGAPASVSGTSDPFESLVIELKQRHVEPEDHYEVAALLESMGWNDDRARRQFGRADVFELAEDVWAAISNRVAFGQRVEETRTPFFAILWNLFRQFLRGAIFALPMAISVASMLILKFSLWSYQYFSVEMATTIAIGTVLSFMTVGGFTQAIARRGYFFIYQGHINLARRSTFVFIRWGFVVSVLVSALLLISNAYAHFFPEQMMWLVVAYYFVLNSIWLSVTAMYILRKEVYFAGLITLGIGVIYLMFIRWHVRLVSSQLVAMLIVAVLGTGLVYWSFLRAERKMERSINVRMPRMAVTFYSTMPYFLYGFLYFCFLFIDRVMAWSMNSPFMPYIIWFRGSYELGLDFALLTLILPLGLSEVIVTKFMLELESSQKRFDATDVEAMKTVYRRSFWNKWLLMAGFALSNAVLIYWLVRFVLNQYLNTEAQISLDSTGLFVFVIALASYVLVSISLSNSVVMFALSQPRMVLDSLTPSIAINLLVGFLCSRWLGYSYAVIGLLAGSGVFMLLTTLRALRMFSRLDYHLYLMS